MVFIPWPYIIRPPAGVAFLTGGMGGVAKTMNTKILVRLLCFVLCLAVLAPCASALGETTKVTGHLVRLREKGSKDADVLDAFPKGTKATVLKKGDTWTKVRIRGKEGYMMTCYLAGLSKEEKKDTKSSKKTSGGQTASGGEVSGDTAYVVKGICLNLRTGKGSDSEIIGSYRGGTKVTVLKQGRHWSLVEVKGKQGYMATEYLTSEKE